MDFKVDTKYSNKGNIRRSEHQLKQYYKEKQNTAKEDTPKEQETTVMGGVVLCKDQVQSIKKSRMAGVRVYNVTFKNGVFVSYMDQTSRKLEGARLNAPGRIFVNNSDINVYNITNGSVFGTSKSENINLDICRCVNVDGNGGNDNYISNQDIEYSHNSYAMHIGDYYEKKQFKGYANWYCQKPIKEERNAASLYGFSFRDTHEHGNYIKALSEIDQEIKERTENSKKVNLKFDISKAEPNLSTENLKKEVLIRAEKGRQEIQKAKFLEVIKEHQDSENSKKLMESVNRQDELLKIQKKHSSEMGVDLDEDPEAGS